MKKYRSRRSRSFGVQHAAGVLLLAAGLACRAAPQQPPGAAAPTGAEMDRTVLPIPEPKRPVYTELDVRNATPPPRFEVKAPEGAPNVLIVLVDDLGFAGTGSFGRSSSASCPRVRRPVGWPV